jgi:hypothetical protein
MKLRKTISVERFDALPFRVRSLFFLSALFMFASCLEQKPALIIRPEAGQNRQVQDTLLDHWQIVGSQNGEGDEDIPFWVHSYLVGGNRGVESLGLHYGKYVFVGENRGRSLNALHRWAGGFTVLHSLPMLIATRVEQRLLAPASLYPDDEYGRFFELLVKAVADGEYPDATIEATFWIKLQRIVNQNDAEEFSESEDDTEMYMLLVLTSINSNVLQEQLKQLMTNVIAGVRPTRDQSAAIQQMQQTFFEGF